MQASRATAQGLQVGLAIGLVAAVALWFGAPTLVGAMAGEAGGGMSPLLLGAQSASACVLVITKLYFVILVHMCNVTFLKLLTCRAPCRMGRLPASGPATLDS